MRLTDIMKAKGITSQQLADATGLNKRTIDEYRNQRKGREPSLSAGLKIADYLGIDPHELLEQENTKMKKRAYESRVNHNQAEELIEEGAKVYVVHEYDDNDHPKMHDLVQGLFTDLEEAKRYADTMQTDETYYVANYEEYLSGNWTDIYEAR